MQKILFVLPSLRTGGMEKLLVTIANKLDDLEYDITVMIFGEDTTLKEELNESISFEQKEPIDPFGRRIPYIKDKFFEEDVWEFKTPPRTFYKHYIGKDKYDVEIAFFRGTSVKIIAGSTNTNAVHLTWVHNDFRKAKRYDQHFESMDDVVAAYKSFDKVVCVSKGAMDGFKEIIGDTGNLTVIYNMIPVEKIKELALAEEPEPIPPARLNLVIVARLLDEHKGHTRLIKVLSRLKNEGCDISLNIVGDGPDRDKIIDCIRELKAEDYIHMAGSKMNPYPYIKAADLLICSSYYEGFNLTVAEALILGTPVLSVDCTGPSEILDDGEYGMLVPNDEEGIYRGIKELYEKPELLEHYQKKALERQSFFDEDKIVKQLTELFIRSDKTTDGE